MTIENNVVKNAGTNGIYTEGTAGNIQIRNNIIIKSNEYGIKGTDLTLQYNNVWDNKLSDYDGISPDINDISQDPLFADPENGDFHLKSTTGRWDAENKEWVVDIEESPCIDAGNIYSDYFNEPDYPDGHINIGAYGNTAEASIGSAITISPTITAYSPTGSDVPTNTLITATFSVAMNQSLTENAFSITPAISGS